MNHIHKCEDGEGYFFRDWLKCLTRLSLGDAKLEVRKSSGKHEASTSIVSNARSGFV
jgi:hypothetical protein